PEETSHPPTDRILTRPQLPGERLTHDRNGWRVESIRRGESAPGDDSNPHGREILLRHALGVDRRMPIQRSGQEAGWIERDDHPEEARYSHGPHDPGSNPDQRGL